MQVYVIVDKVDKNTLTAADKVKFSDVRISYLENGNCCISFSFDDYNYYLEWLKRVNGRPVDSFKEAVRSGIEIEVGDIKDRIADVFKLADFLLLAVAALYRKVGTEGVDPAVATAISDFNTALDNRGTTKFFNLELKESLTAEIQKMVDREKKVVEIIQTNS